MHGGLLAWQEAGYPTIPLESAQDVSVDVDAGVARTTGEQSASTTPPTAAHAHTFLSGLVSTYTTQPGPPIRKELTVLFVDIADSTVNVVSQTPEVALAQVQSFMQVVTDIALAYCGDVKDYE